MAEYKLGRIKFVYQGTWAPSTSYVVDDVVTVGGKTYICIVSNTASSQFSTDLASNYWSKFADGNQWKGAWANSTVYNLGDIVQYGGTVYVANTAHTSISATASITATAATANGTTATITFATQAVQPYLIGATITVAGFSAQTAFNGSFTVTACTTTTVSYALSQTLTGTTMGTVSGTNQLGLEANQSSWDTFSTTFNWISAGWTTNTRYKAKDLLSYNGYTYVCNLAHVSANTTALGLENDSSKWDTFNAGVYYTGVWSGSSVRYKLNDIVKYGADLYICTTQHTSTGTTLDGTKFSIFVNGFEFLNSWSSSTSYVVGDMVTYGGNTYTSILNGSGQVPSTATTYWQPFTTGFSYQGDWASATSYKTGHVVRLGGYTYVATLDNTTQVVNAIATTASTNVITLANGIVITGASVSGNVATLTFATQPSIPFAVGQTIVVSGVGVSAYNGTFVVSGTQSVTQVQYALSGSPASSSGGTVSGTTANLIANLPISFNGSNGNIVSGTTYYVLNPAVNSYQFTITATSGSITPFSLSTTTNLSMAGTTNPTPPFSTYWSRLNSGIRWNSQNATYTSRSGTNVIGTGSGATFNVTTNNTGYTVTVNGGGSGYNLNDKITILGTNVGGLSPANDITITVTNVSSNVIQASGITYTGYAVTWVSGTVYVLGDTVYFGANSYICVNAHVGTSGNRPDADTTATYWNLLASGAESSVLTTQGDLFYYGANGSTRLPIGTDGQVLRVSGTTPAWTYYGSINNIVYVAPAGTDAAGSGQGLSIDKPFKTIRYAAKTIEDGYLNPNASTLLAKNKQFILKEVYNYVTYTYQASVTGTSAGAFTTASTAGLNVGMPITFTAQTGSLTLGGSSFTSSTVYYIKAISTNVSFTVASTYNGTALTAAGTGTATAAYYTSLPTEIQRDTGYTLDGIVYDLSHGGTQKTTANTLAFFTSNGASFINTLVQYEVTQFIGAQNYLSTIIASVLANTAPSSSYQTLNGVSAGVQAKQIIDATLSAETGTTTSAQSLITIIVNALTAGNTTGVPTSINPNTTISVKTGTYNEVLPIVVPANTAIVGDELRSTVVQPQTAIGNLVNDKPKSINALLRTKSLLTNLMANTAIAGSTGNTQVITTTGASSTGGTSTITFATQTSAPFVVGQSITVSGVTPNGFNGAWTVTACTTTSVSFSGSTAGPQTVAGFVSSQVTSLPTGDTGSSAAVQSVVSNVGLIQSILTNGISQVPSFTFTNPTGYNATYLVGYGDGKAQIVQNYAFIKADVSAYINVNYPSVYSAINVAACQRDIGYILDALQYDMTYGCNTQSLIAGSAYFSYSVLDIASTEKTAIIAAYTFLKTEIGNIITKSAITPQSGNTLTQITTGSAGSAGASTFAQARIQEIIDWITNGTGGAAIPPTASIALASSGLQTAYTALTGKQSEIQADTVSWVQKFYQSLTFNSATCSRDAGYIVTALAYDMVLGTNFNSLKAAMSYYRAIASAQIVVSNQLTAEIGSIGFIGYKAKTIAASGSVVQASEVLNDVVANITGVISTTLTTATTSTNVLTVTSTTNMYVGQPVAFTGLPANITTTASATSSSGNTITLGATVASLGIVAGQQVYFYGTATNGAFTVGGTYIIPYQIYYVQSASASVITIAATFGGSAITLATSSTTFNVVVNNAGGLWNNNIYWVNTIPSGTTLTITNSYASGTAYTITNTVTSMTATASVGVVPQTNGTVTYNNTQTTIQGAEILRANTTFLAYEAAAYTNVSYGGTVASVTTGNVINTSSAHNLTTGDPVQFTGTVGASGIVVSTEYYVLAVSSTTAFTITATQGSSTPVTLTNATLGSLTVRYYYSLAKCIRDTTAFINALVYDLNFTGNYKSMRSAVLYNNAVSGSLTSDMFYVRNGTGVRNMTLSGLTGTLGAANAYGTKRPTAGAYTSLDPGFGPNDTNVWITSRSCYAQNVTMFGTACTGMKIDGALHSGGNRSIVANDYTTVLSDGIGVWCTGSNSLTELVSVFNYYGYSGYLAELGGKIRATNGNSSYGTYGVIAEGVDSYETAITGTVNNRANQAYITNVVTDGTTQILRFEYQNAGINYTNNVPSISGAGYNATAIGDEYRDSAVFETRIIDKNDGTGVGGTLYVTQSNTAQGGGVGYITIAATDIAVSNAYNGMRIQVTAGTGVGQYANILSYSNGTKNALLYKDSFTTLGVTATTNATASVTATISSTTTLTVTSGSGLTIGMFVTGTGITAGTYIVSGTGPYTLSQAATNGAGVSVTGTQNTLTTSSTTTLYNGMPLYINTALGGLTANQLYYAAAVVPNSTLFSLGTTSTATTGVTVTTATTTTITVTGTVIANNLITATNTLVAGQIVTFNSSFNGIAQNVTYYVISANLSTSSFSVSMTPNGTAVPITGTTASSTGTVASGLYAAGWDHVVQGTTIANIPDLTTGYIIEPRISYMPTGYTGTARTISASATWQAAAYGSGNFVAVASGGTATSYSTNGTSWTAGGALPSSQTWTDVVYGGGQGAVATAIIGGLGGVGASLTAVLGTGLNATQIVSVTINNGGVGYTTPPTIFFIPTSGGSGATATCTVFNGAIASVTVTVPGSGYSTAPTVQIVTSSVASITPTYWGKNYNSASTVTVAAPFSASSWTSGGTGVTAGNYYSYLNTGVTPNQLNYYQASGSGTTFGTTAPTFTTGSATNGTNITLTYVGTLATATPTFTNYGISSITLGSATINGQIMYGGYGYTGAPTITIADPTARFIAISGASTNSAYQAPTSLGTTWTAGGSLSTSNLQSLAYGLISGTNVYVAVGGASATGVINSSNDGVTWTARTGTALSAGSYSAVTYGAGYFVAINSGGNITTVSSNGVTWTAGGTLPSSTTWTSIAYGNGRFVALSTTGAVAYSKDLGVTWTAASAGPTTAQTWATVRYGEGLFFAVATASTVGATSPDGINWTAQTLPGSSTNWKALAFGNPSTATLGFNPIWIAVSSTSGTQAASIRTGATPLGRVKVASGVVTEIRMIETGSGYAKGNVTATTTSTNVITVDDTTNLTSNQQVEFSAAFGGLSTNTVYYVIGSSIIANTSFQVSLTSGSTTPVTLTTSTPTNMIYRAAPTVTIIDSNHVINANTRQRMGDGVLSNPSFTNRGSANTTATATVAGDGFSDIYQASTYINIAGLYSIPTSGANVQFGSIANTWYKLVATTNVLGIPGNYTAQFQINPALTTYYAPAHTTSVTTRLKYSQVRLTGHDFLYIGTGNQTQTNYPNVNPASAVTSQQTSSNGGGRVFFTSTDQDGNFNVGNLFGVQQATGTASLNASAFNLSGLNSLTLTSLSVGNATITQFSTDPYFTANSDNIVPTQKAIKSYITAQIGGGSSALNVNTLTAGQIFIANNTISNTTGSQILVTSKMNFTGGIDGAPVALVFFGQK